MFVAFSFHLLWGWAHFAMPCGCFFYSLTYQRFNICVCSLGVAAWEGFGLLSESAARATQSTEGEENIKMRSKKVRPRRDVESSSPKGIVRWKGKCVHNFFCAPAAGTSSRHLLLLVVGWEMKVLKTQEFNWSWRACTNSAFMPLCTLDAVRLCVGPTIMTFFSPLLFVLRSVEPWFFVNFPPIKPPLTYAL